MNQSVIGLVSVGGTCRLGRLLGWCGLGADTGVGRCGGRRCSVHASIRAYVLPFCVSPVAVSVCVGGWTLWLCSGGWVKGVTGVILSRVRVCGLFARLRTLSRGVTAGPYLISAKFVPQAAVHVMRCAGCVSAYSSPLSLSPSRLALARFCGRLSCWFRRLYTPSARIPSVMTFVMSSPPSRPKSTC